MSLMSYFKKEAKHYFDNMLRNSKEMQLDKQMNKFRNEGALMSHLKNLKRKGRRRPFQSRNDF